MAATLHFGQANRKAKMIGVHKMLFLLQDFRLQDASLSMSFKAGVGPPPRHQPVDSWMFTFGMGHNKVQKPQAEALVWAGQS